MSTDMLRCCYSFHVLAPRKLTIASFRENAFQTLLNFPFPSHNFNFFFKRRVKEAMLQNLRIKWTCDAFLFAHCALRATYWSLETERRRNKSPVVTATSVCGFGRLAWNPYYSRAGASLTLWLKSSVYIHDFMTVFFSRSTTFCCSVFVNFDPAGKWIVPSIYLCACNHHNCSLNGDPVKTPAQSSSSSSVTAAAGFSIGKWIMATAVCSQKMAARNQIPTPLPADSFGLRCEKYFSELNRW